MVKRTSFLHAGPVASSVKETKARIRKVLSGARPLGEWEMSTTRVSKKKRSEKIVGERIRTLLSARQLKETPVMKDPRDIKLINLVNNPANGIKSLNDLKRVAQAHGINEKIVEARAPKLIDAKKMRDIRAAKKNADGPIRVRPVFVVTTEVRAHPRYRELRGYGNADLIKIHNSTSASNVEGIKLRIVIKTILEQANPNRPEMVLNQLS